MRHKSETYAKNLLEQNCLCLKYKFLIVIPIGPGGSAPSDLGPGGSAPSELGSGASTLLGDRLPAGTANARFAPHSSTQARDPERCPRRLAES